MYKDLFSLDYNCDALLDASTLQEAWDERNFQRVVCMDANRQMNQETIVRSSKKEITRLAKQPGRRKEAVNITMTDHQKKITKMELSIELTRRVSTCLQSDADSARVGWKESNASI